MIGSAPCLHSGYFVKRFSAFLGCGSVIGFVHMKSLSLFILAATLFIGLTFAGNAFFGMDHGMEMGSVECVNHCLSTFVFPAVSSSALPLILFVAFSIALALRSMGGSRPTSTNPMQYNRLTEPIGLLLRSRKLSPVMIRD